jgi:Poly(ADP-ribose) polymerase and DNA-Ligase Zn-finger region
LAHVIEAATTGRAKCRGCGVAIPAGDLRFGEAVPNPFGEGDTTHWFHPECGAFKRPEAFLEALAAYSQPLPDAEGLEAEARRGIEHPRVARINGAERAASGRAQCRHCKETIAKDAWRIALVFYEDGRFAPAGFVHPRCVPAYFETADILGRVRRFSPGLAEGDVAVLQREIAGPPKESPEA